jgi:hypothetical protein
MTERPAIETQTEDTIMTEQEMQEWLAETIDMRNSDEDFDLVENTRILTFEEAGLLTRNKGLVLRTPDGDEFQITIVKSR